MVLMIRTTITLVEMKTPGAAFPAPGRQGNYIWSMPLPIRISVCIPVLAPAVDCGEVESIWHISCTLSREFLFYKPSFEWAGLLRRHRQILVCG